MIRPLPIELPRFAVQQVYRVTRRADHALAWLRGLVHEVSADLRVAKT